MSKPPIFARDDENDTQLFDRWQQLVIEQFPNPERIGCFDRETLRAFVETPAKLDLRDAKYIHVTQCAECTRELQELRGLREERLRLARVRKAGHRFSHWPWITGIAAGVAVAAVLSFQPWRNHTRPAGQSTMIDDSLPAMVDLSTDGLPRTAKQDVPGPRISLPRRLIHLRLVLPYYSPVGTYRIMVASERSEHGVKAEASGSAAAQGSRTEVLVNLDLRQVVPGSYYLGTARAGDGAPYYYPLTVNQ